MRGLIMWIQSYLFRTSVDVLSSEQGKSACADEATQFLRTGDLQAFSMAVLGLTAFTGMGIELQGIISMRLAKIPEQRALFFQIGSISVSDMARKKRINTKKRVANIVGPQVQKRHYEVGLTPDRLAAKCQLHGFDISRGTLSQIEAQLRCVTDREFLALAEVLKSSIDSLFPPKPPRRRRK